MPNIIQHGIRIELSVGDIVMNPMNDYAGDNTSRKNKWKKRGVREDSLRDYMDAPGVKPSLESDHQVENEKAKKLEAEWSEYKINKQKADDRRFNFILITLMVGVAVAITLVHFDLLSNIRVLFGYAMVGVFILGIFHFIFVDIPEKTKEVSGKASKVLKEYHSSIKQQIATEKELDQASHVIALNEIATNDMDPYCSSLAIKESNGNKDKAISLYIKIRVNDLKSKYSN